VIIDVSDPAASDFGVDLQQTLKLSIAGEALEAVDQLDAAGLELAVPAPNAIEWCTGENWCNSADLYEYYGSYQTIRDYFQLRCPICNPGGSDFRSGQPGDCWDKPRSWLESEVLLVWHPENLEDTCPRCHTTRSEFVDDGLLKNYNQMHLLIGMRAGKSMTAALMGTYSEHRILTLAHGWPGGIHGYLGISKAETFEMTFLAASDVQSQDTIWTKFNGFRQNSPWFRKYVPWVARQAEAQARIGMRPWRYDEAVKTIRNEHPRVRLVTNSLNSNSSSQAGRTRILSFVDELARMQQTEGAQGAAEVYRTQEASLQTVRSHVIEYGGLPWLGSMVSVTSPISRDDEAMRLFRRAPQIDGMFCQKWATWEFNPKQPRRNFTINFQKDPVGAERDFGANPPGAASPLIYDERRWLDTVIDGSITPMAEFEYYRRQSGTGDNYLAVRLGHCDVYIDRKPRYFAADAGWNFDCFSVAFGHPEYEVDSHGNDRKITVLDGIIRIVPEIGTEIFFPSVVDTIADLRFRVHVAGVQFDRWNSIQPVQEIREFGIPAEMHSLKDKDFIDWMVDCYSGLFRMAAPADGDVERDGQGNWLRPLQWAKEPPQLAAESAAIYELLGLQRDPDTQRVTNPNKGQVRGYNSDDAARVVVHLHKMIQRAGYTDRYDDRSKRAARRRAEAGSATWQGRGQIARSPAGGVRNWSGGRGW